MQGVNVLASKYSNEQNNEPAYSAIAFTSLLGWGWG